MSQEALECHLRQHTVSSGDPDIDELLAARGFYLLPPHPHYTQGRYRLCRGIHVKEHLSLEGSTVETMAALLDSLGERK